MPQKPLCKGKKHALPVKKGGKRHSSVAKTTKIGELTLAAACPTRILRSQLVHRHPRIRAMAALTATAHLAALSCRRPQDCAKKSKCLTTVQQRPGESTSELRVHVMSQFVQQRCTCIMLQSSRFVGD